VTVFKHNGREIRNVVLIVVDMLKFCYLKKGGNTLNACPAINFMADNGIICLNARSNSFPTQFSYPSIFTSTLSLDNGGYDNGIICRPLTIAEALRDLGFNTIGYSTAAWLGSFYGYNRGFKEFYELFDLNNVWGNFADIYYEYYYNLFAKGIISEDEFTSITGDLFDRALQELLRLCDQTEKQLAVFDYDISLHRHNFAVYRKLLNQLYTQFLKDRKKFVVEFLRNRLELNIKTFLTGEKEKADIKDITTCFPRAAKKILKNFGVRFRSYKQAVPATYLRKLVNKKISDNRGTNFFIWSHFMDVHDHVSIPSKFGFPPNLITLGLRRAFDNDNAIGKKELFPLRYVDKEIAKVINKLKTENLLDSTLIVVCGDHGVGVEAFETKAGNLFDEGTRVPIIFYNPNLNPCTISTPCSLMDIGPTILSLINAPARSEFKGRSLIEDLDTDRLILLESLGAGPGDFRYKAIKIAVIQGRYKLIWREDGYEDSCPAGINYLFDLIDDPHERKNLYDDDIHKSVVSALEKIASERCSRLRCDLKLIDK
jgi:arylsulfatase A-like enzyme